MTQHEQITVSGVVRKVFADRKPYGFYLDTEDASMKDVRIGVWTKEDLPSEGDEGTWTLDLNEKGFYNAVEKTSSVVEREDGMVVREKAGEGSYPGYDRYARERALGCAVASTNEEEKKFPPHIRAHVVAEIAEIFEAWLTREA